MPIDSSLVSDQDGKSLLRARYKIHVAPVRPIVNDPCFNVVIPFNKQVGLVGTK